MLDNRRICAVDGNSMIRGQHVGGSLVILLWRGEVRRTMETPEVQQLYRRYRRYQQLADHYATVLNGLRSAEGVLDAEAGTVTFHTMAMNHTPKSIPRGKPVAWYLEKYRYYAAKASDTGDLYWSLKDDAQKRAWSALDREGKLAVLREIGGRMRHMEETIREYRAKIPAWEHEAQTLAARADASGDVRDQVYLEMHLKWPPHAMVKVMTESLQEAQAEHDWLLEHI